MAYRVEIDQSNKVEDSGDTFLAFSNGIAYTIRVPFRAKRAGIDLLRQRGKSKRTATLMLFAACVYLLVEGHLSEIDRIILDNEYAGREADIKAFFVRFLQKRGKTFPMQYMNVSSIGKKSEAHRLVWEAYRGISRQNKGRSNYFGTGDTNSDPIEKDRGVPFVLGANVYLQPRNGYR